MDKRKLTEVFEEVIKDWKMAQSDLIDDGACEYTHEEMEEDIENYRKKFEEALNG